LLILYIEMDFALSPIY